MRVLEDLVGGQEFRIAETLDKGFSNAVYRVEVGGESLVAKVFSESAKVRCPAGARGLFDELAGAAHLGPRVRKRTPDGLLMEYVNGVTLTAEDLKRDAWAVAVEKVAPKLAAVHALPVEASEAVLWRGIDAMLARVGNFEGFGDLEVEVARSRRVVETELGPPDACAHGDLKPSNILRVCDDVLFVDFELAGPGYAAYDVAKLFRTEPYDAPAGFLREYLRARGIPRQTLAHALKATALLEPLAWLEAVVFFLFMATTTAASPDPGGSSSWIRLARDRYRAYEAAVRRQRVRRC
ncbi:hypothetical protein CTAYLR_005503 [Chrysophaeum taylorii]|uniref:Aminoglycoside phosphotransferase domain-containing protein n=1 Tax=Chrysophaeum taylorii TaxID=2483200 RepID=A0AAD7U4L7_9STRA|nr:hypothetical protein CTAYLR_005503 [Chrysophaeum taylorii]